MNEHVENYPEQESSLISIWTSVVGIILLRLDYLWDEIEAYASSRRVWMTILSAFGLYFMVDTGAHLIFEQVEPMPESFIPALIWNIIRIVLMSLLPFLLACWVSYRFLGGNSAAHFQGLATVMAGRMLVLAVLSVISLYASSQFQPTSLITYYFEYPALQYVAILVSYLAVIWFYVMLYLALRMLYPDASMYRLVGALVMIFACLVLVPLLLQEVVLDHWFWFDLGDELTDFFTFSGRL